MMTARLVFLGLFCFIAMTCATDKSSEEWCIKDISAVINFFTVTLPKVRDNYGLADTPEKAKMKESLFKVIGNMGNVYQGIKACGVEFPHLQADLKWIQGAINRSRKLPPKDGKTGTF